MVSHACDVCGQRTDQQVPIVWYRGRDSRPAISAIAIATAVMIDDTGRSNRQ